MSNNKLYPIKFISKTPQQIFGDEAPDGNEIWNLYSIFGESTEIENGYLQGNTLDDLMEIYLGDSVGDAIFQHYKGEFPFLIRTINLAGDMPVFLYPDDHTAFEREETFGGESVWYVKSVKQGAKVYIGLKKDSSAEEIYNCSTNGTFNQILTQFTPKVGDTFYIEPNTPFSASGEIELIQIGQSTDLIYSLGELNENEDELSGYDNDITEAIDIINYNKVDKEKIHFKDITTALKGEKLNIRKRIISESDRIYPSLFNSFIIFICLNGDAILRMNDKSEYQVNKGEVIFIPAAMEDFIINPSKDGVELLEIIASQPKAAQSDNYVS